MTAPGQTGCHHQPPPPVLQAHNTGIRWVFDPPNRRKAMGWQRGTIEELIYKTRARRERAGAHSEVA